MLLSASESYLLLIDTQQRLLPAMHRPVELAGRIALLAAAARRLAVPAVITEHCADKIGPTIPELRPFLPKVSQVVPKVTFSAMGADGFVASIDALSGRHAVVAGMEAHVCVLQTVCALSASGRSCSVVADAVGSRRAADHDAALARLRDHGVGIVTSEMVVFEWLGRAESEDFSALLPCIKRGAPPDFRWPIVHEQGERETTHVG